MKKKLLVLVISLIAGFASAQVMEPEVFCINNQVFFFEQSGENLKIVKYYASLCQKYERLYFKNCSEPIYLTWVYHPSDTTNPYSIGWENILRFGEMNPGLLDNCIICILGIRIELPIRWGEEENLIRILTYGLNNKLELQKLRDSMIANKLKYSACHLSDTKIREILESELSKKQIRFINRFKNRYNPDKVHLTRPRDNFSKNK